MPKLDLAAIEMVQRTGYPPPHDQAVQGRWQRRFAEGCGAGAAGRQPCHARTRRMVIAAALAFHRGRTGGDALGRGRAGGGRRRDRRCTPAISASGPRAWPTATASRTAAPRRAASSRSVPGRIPAAAIRISTCAWGPEASPARTARKSDQAFPATSNCEIVHSSAIAASIQLCIQSCSHTACI